MWSSLSLANPLTVNVEDVSLPWSSEYVYAFKAMFL